MTVVTHPLVQHKLTLMRDVNTTTVKFSTLLREMSLIETAMPRERAGGDIKLDSIGKEYAMVRLRPLGRAKQ